MTGSSAYRLLAATAILVAMAGCSSSSSKSPLESHRFADGSELVLEDTTFGARPTFTKDGNTFSESFETDKLNVWASFNDSTSSVKHNASRAVAVDSHGCTFPNEGQTHWFSIGRLAPWPFRYFTRKRPPDLVVASFPVAAFPRREQTMKLQFLKDYENQSGAEFEIPNPAPGPYPTWTAEPFPATKQVAGLSATLKNLNASQSTDVLHPPIVNILASGDLSISQNGKPAPEWEAARVSVSDATGNEVQWSGSGNSRGDINLVGRSLCPEESAWKLRLELCRAPQSNFEPASVWTVQKVPIPSTDELIRLEDSTTLGGVTLKLLGVSGRGNVMWEPGNTMTAFEPLVRLGVSLPCDGVWVTLTVVDSKGQRYYRRGGSPSDRSADGIRIFTFTLPKDPALGPIDLHFAIQRTIAVEFVVKPTGSK